MTARPVPAGTFAPAGPKADASPCARGRSMKLCNAHERRKVPTNGSNAMPTGQASRAPSPKASKALACGRSRYRGTAKTHLQHILIAAAMDLTRLDAWLTGTPLAPTRTSHCAALHQAA
ncbi:hypothetical protein GCM10010404_93300 [Nonomuraea africana]